MESRFITLCSRGNLNEATELLRLYPETNISYEEVFKSVCCRGQLHVAKWLLQIKPDINISYNNEEVFRYVCVVGRLHVAKWLLSVKPDINISYNMFHIVCIDEQFEFAKWLLQVKPDININAALKQNAWFCYFCEKGQLELAQWVQSLNTYLYVIEYDDNGNYSGYKIRTKEEANWQKRKCALHLALQEETNILYHLPRDIAKSVTLFV